MKIAMIGLGKMGHEILPIAKSRGHEIITIDPKNDQADFLEINDQSLEGVDVAIDFTHPDVVLGNIEKLTAYKTNMVIGTTGWYDQLEQVKAWVDEQDIGLLWSGNFSIGMNALFSITEHAAKLINNIAEYDIMAHEFHHNQKADSPSGTAEMIGQLLIDNIDRKETVVREKLDRPINDNELHLTSTRGGSIPGTHSVMFDSPADTIEIKHTARNRAGFALGAVLAAEYIDGKHGVYHIKDMMQSMLEGKK